jgi:hypothetical protein
MGAIPPIGGAIQQNVSAKMSLTNSSSVIHRGNDRVQPRCQAAGNQKPRPANFAFDV